MWYLVLVHSFIKCIYYLHLFDYQYELYDFYYFEYT